MQNIIFDVPSHIPFKNSKVFGYNYLPKPRVYPKGYKQYRVLKALHEKGQMSRAEIRKLAFELSYGKDTYSPKTHTDQYNYWNDAFYGKKYELITEFNTFTVGGPWMIIMCSRIGNHSYKINHKGLKKLNELEKRFNNV